MKGYSKLYRLVLIALMLVVFVGCGGGSSGSNLESSGSPIYIAGLYFDGAKYVPCYWKGTTRIDLPGGSSENSATDFIDNLAHGLFISNGIVYTAGRYYNGTKTVACYWAGRNRFDLEIPRNASLAMASSIYVSAGLFI